MVEALTAVKEVRREAGCAGPPSSWRPSRIVAAASPYGKGAGAR